MPQIMHVSASPSELILEKLTAAGLTPDQAPQAVQIAMQLLQQHLMGPVYRLVAELPNDARAWEWLSIVFQSYGEFCANTVVVDALIAQGDGESGNIAPGDGSGDGGGSGTEAV